MILTHYSEKLLALDYRRQYLQGMLKPNGLWLSVGDAWPNWCRDAQFERPMDFATRFEVDAERLVVVRPEYVAEFSRQFAAPYPNTTPNIYRVAWDLVAADCAGVLFVPYNKWAAWASGGDSFLSTWYDSIDCESACVWDLSAIQEVK